MESVSNFLPIFSQLIAHLTSKDKAHRSEAELAVSIKHIVNECFEKHAAAERKEIMNSLMEIVREKAVQPNETQRVSELDDLLKQVKVLNAGNKKKESERSEAQNMQMMIDLLKEMLNIKESGPDDARCRTRKCTDNNNFVLPWCDKPDTQSQAKYSDKGKQFSETKGSVNDARGKNFKDQGAYGKKSFANQQKNFHQGRGDFRRGKKSHSSERIHNKYSRPCEEGVPLNNMPYGGHGYRNDQHFSGQHQPQHWQLEGAVGYGSPISTLQQRPVNNQMYQQPFGITPPLANNDQFDPANQNYQQSSGNHNFSNFNHKYLPRHQLGNIRTQLFPQPPQRNPSSKYGVQQQYPSFPQADAPHGEYANHQQTQQNFLRSNNFRGRGGFQRGGHLSRSGNANRKEAENDDQEDDAKYLPTNGNKVIEGKLLNDAQSTGARKGKKTKPDDDQKPKEAGVNQSGAPAIKKVESIIGLGINKDVLKNVDENQELKHVYLHDQAKAFQPKTVGELKKYMEKIPKANAFIRKE